ncbi:MAG: DoxX family protein [Bacteroidia bacterium]|nr:DoxX family protein [Bacteroidia bacterium]MBT8276428.1 DoxX family protein [Bacteroidia bacterium]NNF30352.1 DoxX family membrane protein [Flavobacteriaceae bacterium]NNJ80944.1 DoxX family membrane protein [Flavobacteriaceae bacterium]NNM08713.1 DoxX family membrane protein [Flavobacteriaceae bacterium]
MKALVGVTRIFVGILFIISGLIKLNDPVGFSFKLQDYFAPEVLNLEFLTPFALVIAIFVVIYEVLLGVMIIIGYAKKFTLWSLLLMIVFFTFLTFYSAVTGKVTDCGCFGDALKLTPWQSFYKDVFLLVLILISWFGRKHIQPFFSRNIRSLTVFASLVVCLAIMYHVLMHLPIIDFRPYKIEANITEGMSIPEDAPKPIFEYAWKFNVNGEEKIITTNGDYPQQEGEFIGVETKEIQAGYEPPIHDFSMERGGNDFTDSFLNAEHVIVVIAYSLSNSEKEGFIPVREVTDEALEKGYQVIGLSASSEEVTDALVEEYGLNFKFYFCDMTTLKTIVRSNPGILELQKGTIKQKLHWNDASELRLKELPKSKPEMDMALKQKLDSIAELDQRYRKLMYLDTEAERAEAAKQAGFEEEDYSMETLWARQSKIDSTNMEFIAGILDTNGYPGKSMVDTANKAAWYVLQHNPDRIEEYLPMIKTAGEEGELPFNLVAMMEDRYLMGKGEPQIYGTQGMSYDDERGNLIWPISDPENVNERREQAGFDNTIEEYAKALFGEDFEYKVLTMEDVKED